MASSQCPKCFEFFWVIGGFQDPHECPIEWWVWDDSQWESDEAPSGTNVFSGRRDESEGDLSKAYGNDAVAAAEWYAEQDSDGHESYPPKWTLRLRRTDNKGEWIEVQVEGESVMQYNGTEKEIVEEAKGEAS